MKKGELVSVNGYLYEYVEDARSWKGHLHIVRSLITNEACVQIPGNIKKANQKDILSFLSNFIDEPLNGN